MKNPWLVAVLNFVFLGLGTMLVGRRVGVGLGLTVGGLLLRVEEIRIAPAFSGVFQIHWVPLIAGMTIAGFVLAIDGFKEAKQAA
ncbi:MAG: hypothetical protein QM723_19285 [Myxococcaceae bacterium]